MSDQMNHGGEGDLAPVIPLFGASREAASAHIAAPADNAWVRDENPDAAATDADGWFVEDDETDGVQPDESAPVSTGNVRPLASAKSVASRGDETGSRLRHPTSAPTLMRASDLAKPASEREGASIPGADRVPQPLARWDKPSPRLRVVEQTEAEDEGIVNPAEQRDQAESALVKKLRGRGMSVSEARGYLRGLGYDDDVQNDVVDLCVQRGYLDDAVLAEQLVYAGSTRKGQGRRAISLALSQRGIDRTTIDAALADLPDDDAERALEFARTRANSLARLENDVALRRLMGQLARRGFGGSVARDAAQQALREVSGPRFR